MSSSKFVFKFGALAPSLADQLKADDRQSEILAPYQKDADAITRLSVRGLLSEAEIYRARTRLVQKIQAEVERGIPEL